MDKALAAFQRGNRIQKQSLENETTLSSMDPKRPSIASMSTRQSFVGRQISTMRLKEGYHHYRKPDTEVVEIGDEEYASVVPFIYDAAYPQNERDTNGNKITTNIHSFFSTVNGGFSGENVVNKVPSERSSGPQGPKRSATPSLRISKSRKRLVRKRFG